MTHPKNKEKDKDNKNILTLPYSVFKVNLYSFTVLNKLKETRLLKQVELKERPHNSQFVDDWKKEDQEEDQY